MIVTDSVLNKLNDAKPVIPESIISKHDISFENLVNILPIGLESKKRIFERISFSTMT